MVVCVINYRIALGNNRLVVSDPESWAVKLVQLVQLVKLVKHLFITHRLLSHGQDSNTCMLRCSVDITGQSQFQQPKYTDSKSAAGAAAAAAAGAASAAAAAAAAAALCEK